MSGKSLHSTSKKCDFADFCPYQRLRLPSCEIDTVSMYRRLLLQIVVVLLQTRYILITRCSSECWDTPERLIVLAQQSRAPGKLENTCSGIKRFGTTALNTCVRRVPRANHDGEEETNGDGNRLHESRARKSKEGSRVRQIIYLNGGPSIGQGICRLIGDCLGARPTKNVRVQGLATPSSSQSGLLPQMTQRT